MALSARASVLPGLEGESLPFVPTTSASTHLFRPRAPASPHADHASIGSSKRAHSAEHRQVSFSLVHPTTRESSCRGRSAEPVVQLVEAELPYMPMSTRPFWPSLRGDNMPGTHNSAGRGKGRSLSLECPRSCVKEQKQNPYERPHLMRSATSPCTAYEVEETETKIITKKLSWEDDDSDDDDRETTASYHNSSSRSRSLSTLMNSSTTWESLPELRRQSSVRSKESALSTLSGYVSKAFAKRASERSYDPLSHYSSDNAVIIIDWDDTIMPTTYIQQVVEPTLSGEWCVPEDNPHFLPLVAHAYAVETMLRACSQAARVVIVSLATEWWVTTSSQRFLPGVVFEDLASELDISIYYADRQAPLLDAKMTVAEKCIAAKKAAMANCLENLYGGRDVRWNVMSIGDSRAEAAALKGCLREAEADNKQPPLCKTVKLHNSPSLGELSRQLKLMAPQVKRLVQTSKGFSRTTSSFLFSRNSLWAW